MVKRRAWRCPRWECSRKGAGGWRVRLGVNASSYHTVLCMVLHNLYFYNTMMEEIRDAIDAGEFQAYKKRKLEGMEQK